MAFVFWVLIQVPYLNLHATLLVSALILMCSNSATITALSRTRDQFISAKQRPPFGWALDEVARRFSAELDSVAPYTAEEFEQLRAVIGNSSCHSEGLQGSWRGAFRSTQTQELVNRNEPALLQLTPQQVGSLATFDMTLQPQPDGSFTGEVFDHGTQMRATVIGAAHSKCIVFTKRYGPGILGSLSQEIYYGGRLSPDGLSASGSWQMARGGESGTWIMRRY